MLGLRELGAVNVPEEDGAAPLVAVATSSTTSWEASYHQQIAWRVTFGVRLSEMALK